MWSRRWEPASPWGACGRPEPGPEDELAWPGRGGNAGRAPPGTGGRSGGGGAFPPLRGARPPPGRARRQAGSTLRGALHPARGAPRIPAAGTAAAAAAAEYGREPPHKPPVFDENEEGKGFGRAAPPSPVTLGLSAGLRA